MIVPLNRNKYGRASIWLILKMTWLRSKPKEMWLTHSPWLCHWHFLYFREDPEGWKEGVVQTHPQSGVQDLQEQVLPPFLISQSINPVFPLVPVHFIIVFLSHFYFTNNHWSWTFNSTNEWKIHEPHSNHIQRFACSWRDWQLILLAIIFIYYRNWIKPK